MLRRLMKFSHTMGAIGLMGAMACLLVLLAAAPPPSELAEYALIRGAMAEISRWVFMPSLLLTLVAGLLAFALTPAFHNAGWVLAKLATGIIVFEYSFLAVQGPMQGEALRAARALAGKADPATLGRMVDAEWVSLWVLMIVATANVVLGVWRPRFTRRRARLAASTDIDNAAIEAGVIPAKAGIQLGHASNKSG